MNYSGKREMDPTTLLTSLSLAMDCFSVSISNSACHKKFRAQEALTLATSFGSFQFLMLCFGWILGASLINYIEALDHWVAFALLLLVGV
ncbi:MAG: manganese efflux pump, partial [Candidatus Korarchaeum sp.]|nr:manganese efflux pump [Candidatus Korarchaeum sp.]MDW8035422.1 manganese efflux pump [Candidatus Korarchaeum sp.]